MTEPPLNVRESVRSPEGDEISAAMHDHFGEEMGEWRANNNEAMGGNYGRQKAMCGRFWYTACPEIYPQDFLSTVV